MNYLMIGASSAVAGELIKKLNKRYKAEDIRYTQEQDAGKGSDSESGKEGRLKPIVYAQYLNNDTAVTNLKEECDALDIRPVRCDLCSDEDIEALLDVIRQDKTEIGTLVYTAAAPLSYSRIRKWDVEKLRRDMQSGAIAFTQICSEIAPAMSKRGYGKIVVMLTSAISDLPPRFMADYVMIKSALWGYTKALASEYSDKGLCVNALSPSMMETAFLREIDERVVQADAESSPRKRHIRPDEVADAMMFLISPKSDYMTGVNLNLSGGEKM